MLSLSFVIDVLNVWLEDICLQKKDMVINWSMLEEEERKLLSRDFHKWTMLKVLNFVYKRQ